MAATTWPATLAGMNPADFMHDRDATPVRVELRAARIPFIGFLAHHHWFVVQRAHMHDRWEVWQTAEAGGVAVGHLHCNLWPPERGVGNGPSWIVHCWHDREAEELARRIEASPQTYPWCLRYRPIPGPNSNTYVQWLLGSSLRLGPRAIGKTYASALLHRKQLHLR
jgi:hypothetical protein